MLRTETKFFVKPLDCLLLRKRLEFIFGPCGWENGNGSYPVLSRYFDTTDMEFYWAKTNGEHEHDKIRIRQYAREFGATGSRFLEAKIKKGAFIQKVRVALPHHVLGQEDRLEAPVFSRLDLPGMGGVLDVLDERDVYAICDVLYEREAFRYWQEEHSLRITLDSAITVRLVANLPITARPFGDIAVLEIKSTFPLGTSSEMAEVVKDEIGSFALEPQRISKYASAIDCFLSDGL